MVHKGTTRARGRPRAYDPDQALAAAMQAFWRLGYAGTSLEELSEATDMNRPSLYAAFGDKHTLYLKTLDLYLETAQREVARIMESGTTLLEALTALYERALSWYMPEGEPARGCYLIATAATQCMLDAQVRQRLQVALGRFEKLFEQRFRQAQTAGELPAGADPAALASVALAVNHTLALRTRAGVTRDALHEVIDNALLVMCGTKPVRKA